MVAYPVTVPSTTLLLSILVLVIIFCGGYFFRTVPWALFTVIGAAIASWALNLAAFGVTTICTMAGGLPVIAFPIVPPGQITELLGIDWKGACI